MRGSSSLARWTASLVAAVIAGGASFAAAARPNLDGKRLADKILTASDAERAQLPQKAIAQALRRHGATVTALRADFVRAHRATYTKALPKTDIRDQGETNRCWIFSALNLIERAAQLKTGQPVKLSRAYIDARNLQENAYRLLRTGSIGGLNDSTVPETGQFGYALGIIERFGAVPEKIMRDFYDAKNSATTIKLLETILADAHARARTASRRQKVAIAEQARAEIDRTIARAFTGQDALPDKFVFEGKTYTPKRFAEKHLPVRSSDFVTLTAARGRRGWQRFGSGVHKTDVFNAKSIEIIKQAIIASIDQGEKVYISVPVDDAAAPYMVSVKGKAGLPDALGIMSIHAFDYKTLGMPTAVTDRDTIQRQALNPPNHAMTITGYDLDANGKVLKWEVENSWGKSAGDQGIEHMYDDFLTAFVGKVTLPRAALPPALVKQMRQAAD